MTKISELLSDGPTLSVEFFPPKTAEGLTKLDGTLDDLQEIKAADGTKLSFVSVTYGAGGSTRDRTRDLVVGINEQRPFPAMPHLTCMGHTKAEIDSLLSDYSSSGIENILALGGDPPSDGSEATGDFNYALELIEATKAAGDFAVGVAAHPETHPRSPSTDSDRRFLAEKLSAADFGITQFFFDADDYFAMVNELADIGCTTPILPGVMPLLNPATVQRFAGMAKAEFPTELADRIEAAETTQDKFNIAADAAADLAAELVDRGVPGIHLYCMNRSDIAAAVLDRIPGITSPA